jgi:predicted Zn-dependent protease
LAKAGYEPTAMISFMQKLAQQGGSTPTILSTHPATNDRIVALQKQLNSVNN